METSDDPERRSDSAKARATRARRLAASLEERAESMHRAAAAAQTNVAAFAEMVRENEPAIASRIDVDPGRYRTRAAQETARADDARRRREEDEHAERGGRQEPKAQEGREPEADSETVES